MPHVVWLKGIRQANYSVIDQEKKQVVFEGELSVIVGIIMVLAWRWRGEPNIQLNKINIRPPIPEFLRGKQNDHVLFWVGTLQFARVLDTWG